ncbi:type VI secretion system ATPase TssH, partial [Salmonella enterica subsp. enterica serovar Albany]|nr:type VI secretion system ATPase TssH [Salmonella enterica subsp. enterica serovar Albany]
IGLRPDGGRRDEVHTQYETAQAELQALDAAWHQQQVLVQEITALRQTLLTEAEAQDEDDAANDDVLPQADTVPEETTAAAERLASLCA